jgi:hypothetical protein
VTDHKDKPDISQDLSIQTELYRRASGLDRVEDANPIKAEHMRRVKRCGAGLQDGEITIVVRNGRVTHIRKTETTDYEY